MPRTRPPYSAEFRLQMVDLVRAGRSPEDLAREIEPTAQSIAAWAAVADKQEGGRKEVVAGLSATERDELARLRRENKQLRVERAALRRRGDRNRRRVHERGQRGPVGQHAAAAHRPVRDRETGPASGRPRDAGCLLSRSALGSPMTQYTSHSAAYARAAKCISSWSITADPNGWAGAVLVVVEVHPLRRVHEHLPGVPPQWRPELWSHLCRADRSRHRPDVQRPQIQQAAVFLNAERQLHGRLPGDIEGCLSTVPKMCGPWPSRQSPAMRLCGVGADCRDAEQRSM